MAGAAFDLAVMPMAPAAAAAARPEVARRLAKRAEPERWLRVDRRSLPEFLGHAVVRAHRVQTAEVEVRVVDEAGRTDGCWARAFDEDGALVALAPLRARGRDGTALLLVAPEVIDDVSVDVTDQPGLPRASVAFEAVQHAIAEGRDAASAERVGDRKETAMRWHRCAQQWSTAGDETRANTAAEYSAAAVTGRGGDRRIPPALIADRIDPA